MGSILKLYLPQIHRLNLKYKDQCPINRENSKRKMIKFNINMQLKGRSSNPIVNIIKNFHLYPIPLIIKKMMVEQVYLNKQLNILIKKLIKKTSGMILNKKLIKNLMRDMMTINSQSTIITVKQVLGKNVKFILISLPVINKQ